MVISQEMIDAAAEQYALWRHPVVTDDLRLQGPRQAAYENALLFMPAALAAAWRYSSGSASSSAGVSSSG